MHGSLYVVAGRHPAAGWIVWKILFVQRHVTCWHKSGASLASRTCARWQFRLAVLLPPRVESDFCGRIVACGSGTDAAHAIQFFAGSYGGGACRRSCFPRRDAEPFDIAHSGRDPVTNFKKMQL